MGKPLIIVESPAKARSMSKYLGNDFTALASYGHVRDLQPKSGAVLPDENFAMRYEIVDRNRRHVDAIERAMKGADSLYLATDPDREGEAIAWHLLELLKERAAIGDKPVYRVEFHEITAAAIRAAVAAPRKLSTSLVDAQQARRALDYLVGFNLSPLLWKKVHGGLSAGRVQSPALRLICEREAEIEKFTRREYWSVEAHLRAAGEAFVARLTHFEGEKLEQFSIADQARAGHIEATLKAAAGATLSVTRIDKKQRKRHPAPPFTTSTLQQEASRKLGFSARRTMQVAQRLYEGMDIDGDATGLITYMRTDSVALAGEAVGEIRALIKTRYGADMLPEAARVFKNKTKNAQEAHEAIRPTLAARAPQALKAHLSTEQHRLYELIWKRTVACQMIHATIDTVAADLAAGAADLGHTFRATGSTVRIPGFMAVYTEGRDDQVEPVESGAQNEKSGEKGGDVDKSRRGDASAGGQADAPTDESRRLPVMRPGDAIALNKIHPQQHFTEPPPRFNEATLVKTLEAYGIGRPSTYASIIDTLQKRGYAILEKRRFEPTDTGNLVNRFLSKHFTTYIDYEFTARLEDDLDAISRGEKQWIPIMQTFWKDFYAQLVEKGESVTREDALQARQLGAHPKSGKPMSVRMGRYGPYVQIGSREDEEKPTFAGLRRGQKIDAITMAEALELFKLPRALGETPQGEAVSVAIGRFGPYVKYGDKYVSLGQEHDPYTVELPIALQLVADKKIADANRIIVDFTVAGVQVLNGRYGPYITDGEKNARIPKSVDDPKTLTLKACQELLKTGKPVRGKKKAAKKKTVAKKTASKKVSKKTTRRAG